MNLIRYFPTDTKIPFMRWLKVTAPVSIAASLLSIVLVFTVGLNFGIDFQGGTVIEMESRDGPVDLATLREAMSSLGLGDVQVQEFGSPNVALVRVQRQEGGDEAQQRVVAIARGALPETIEFRRTEVVGPRVSGELARNGIIGVGVALAAIMVYLWFRFEWQYALGAVLTTLHDVILTIGLFVVLQLDFSLSSIAAILTILGYSLNDTVVVYDRIRENLRKYRRMALPELIDLSINETLSRTVMTSMTTLLALLALYLFGGEVISSFVLAMIWGIVVGTFSSIFISAPLLILFGLRPTAEQPTDKPQRKPATP